MIVAVLRHGERADRLGMAPGAEYFNTLMTPLGLEQAEAAGAELEAHRIAHNGAPWIVYTSPFLRTLQTTGAALRKLKTASSSSDPTTTSSTVAVHIDAGLCEHLHIDHFPPSVQRILVDGDAAFAQRVIEESIATTPTDDGSSSSSSTAAAVQVNIIEGAERPPFHEGLDEAHDRIGRAIERISLSVSAKVGSQPAHDQQPISLLIVTHGCAHVPALRAARERRPVVGVDLCSYTLLLRQPTDDTSSSSSKAGEGPKDSSSADVEARLVPIVTEDDVGTAAAPRVAVGGSQQQRDPPPSSLWRLLALGGVELGEAPPPGGDDDSLLHPPHNETLCHYESKSAVRSLSSFASGDAPSPLRYVLKRLGHPVVST